MAVILEKTTARGNVIRKIVTTNKCQGWEMKVHSFLNGEPRYAKGFRCRFYNRENWALVIADLESDGYTISKTSTRR